MSEKDNEFNQIIDEFPDTITEEDLKKLLEIKLSFFQMNISGF